MGIKIKQLFCWHEWEATKLLRIPNANESWLDDHLYNHICSKCKLEK